MMDASAQRHGGGHYLLRHDRHMMNFMSDYYLKISPELGAQARLEVAIHIAVDKGYINRVDYSLMSDFWRILHKKGGRRGVLKASSIERSSRKTEKKPG